MLKAERAYFRKSKAKTAWGLMQAVNRAILAEPKRIYMGNWISSFLDRDEAMRSAGHAPRCGTVGCYAGWVTLLHEGQESSAVEDKVLQLLAGDNPILGKSLSDAFITVSVSDVVEGNYRYLDSGTKPYAQAVVARFTAIMEQHKAYLKARAV